MYIPHSALHAFTVRLLRAAGSSGAEAKVVADHLIRANLTGHDSHGVGMLPTYVRSIKNGLLHPDTPVRQIQDSGSILVFDGERGFGQRVAREAMEQAILRCREQGLVLMALRNAHHIGRIGTYGEQSIAAGLASIHFVNVTDHPPVVAVHNGADARLLTNPVCVAMPGTGQNEAFLLDMATSKIALGKARVAMNAGKPVPPDTLLDAQGRPTTDPHVLFADPRGAIKPFGSYKGFGIAFACELLAGVLTGGGTIHPAHARHGSIVNNMLTFIVDPQRLVEHDWLDREIDALTRYALESPSALDADDDIMLAGEPERRACAERQLSGIPLDAKTRGELLEACLAVGLSDPSDEELLGRP